MIRKSARFWLPIQKVWKHDELAWNSAKCISVGSIYFVAKQETFPW